MLLSTAYLAPVSWFSLAAKGMTLSPDRVLPSIVYIEANENYIKQTYRNRSYILAGDGVQMLQVPVVHSGSMRIKEVRIDRSTPWVMRTERALDTAYFTAAYYEYYRDDLFALLESEEECLWAYNKNLTLWCAKKCGIALDLRETESFLAPGETKDDFRFSLTPKRPFPEGLGEKEHYQVFRDRMGGFTPRLSILDLLFNEGPNSISYL